MKKLILFLATFTAVSLAHADVKISQLPLGSAASTNTNDSFPYVNSVAGETERLDLSDLVNLPAFVTEFSLLVPSQSGQSGKCLGTNGTITAWVSCGSGGGSPGGSSSDVQYNSSGSFAGNSSFTYNGSGIVTATTFVGALTGNASTASTAAALSQSITSGLPVIGNGTGVTAGTKSGSTTEFATVTGTLTSGDCLQADASGNVETTGSACGSGGGTPGGSNTQVQFNNSGSFGGSSSLTWNGTALTSGQIIDSGLTASTPVITNSSKQLASGTYSGNTTDIATVNGSLTSGDCLQADANGNIETTGAACGTGTGGITALTGDVTASGSGSVAATLAATSNATLTTLSALTTAGSLATVGTIGSGTWHGTAIGATYGGTGISTAASTGVPSISSGTWSVSTTLPTSLGGLGASFSGSTGALSVSSGTVSAGTLAYSNGGTNATSQGGLQANASTQTTKGDVQTYSTLPVRHAVPGDYGRFIPDSNQADGWRSASYTQIQNGRPGKNYIQYADFENGITTGWSLGTIGTLTNGLPTGSPTFGSGAAGSLSIDVNSSTPIAGAYTLEYVSSAATTVGNMVATSSLPIDTEDQGKVLGVHFYYEAGGGFGTGVNLSGTSSNSYVWAVYDVTNSTWLSSTGNFCMNQSKGSGYCSGTVQTGTSTANLRFVLYNANATSGSSTVELDDFYLGPQVTPLAPAMTDWVAYTPTWVGSSSNPAIGNGTVSGMWRRVGKDMQINISVTTGSSTTYGSGNYYFTIPAGYTVDSSALAYGSAALDAGILGSFSAFESGTTRFTGFVGLNTSTQVQLMTSQTQGGSAPYFVNTNQTLGNTTPVTWSGSGNVFSMTFEAPIVGWSSNTATSQDASALPVAALYTGAPPTGTLTNAFNNTTYGTKVVDTCGGMSGATYTICSSGYYNVSVSRKDNITYSSGCQANMGLAVNGVSDVYNGAQNGASGMGSLYPTVNLQGVYFAAGTTLTPQSYDSCSSPSFDSGVPNNFFSISKVSGNNAVQANPNIAFTYYGSTQALSATPSALIEPTKLTDTMGLYNTTTGLYPAPVSGTYHCDCNYNATASGTTSFYTQFYVGGSAVGEPYQGFSNATTCSSGLGLDMPVLAGQTIGCYAYLGGGTASAVQNSNFSCHRVGY